MEFASASRQRARETPSPTDLIRRVLYFVLPKLNLKIWQVSPQRMEGDAVVDRRLHRIRLIVSYLDIARLVAKYRSPAAPDCGPHGLTMRSAKAGGSPQDCPSSNESRARSKRLPRDSRSIRIASIAAVIGLEPAFDALRSGGCREIQVSWDHGAVTALRNEIGGIQVTIAIDHQPGDRDSTQQAHRGWPTELRQRPPRQYPTRYGARVQRAATQDRSNSAGICRLA